MKALVLVRVLFLPVTIRADIFYSMSAPLASAIHPLVTPFAMGLTESVPKGFAPGV